MNRSDSTPDRAPLAVVTGASGGIGSAIARQLAGQGYSLLLHGFQNVEALKQLQRQFTNQSVQANFITCDLSKPIERAAFVESVIREFETPRVLVNNAGADVLTGERADGSFAEKLEYLWQADVCNTIELSRMFGAEMRKAAFHSDFSSDEPPSNHFEQQTTPPAEMTADSAGVIVESNRLSARFSQRPTIVNIGWDQAESGMGGDSGEMFAAIKGAIMAFTRSLAKSLAPQVTVNCVAPGWIKTKWGDQANDYWSQRAIQESLVSRWGRPTDIAATVGFLASPAGEFVNGQIVNVNGGYRGSAE